jgi:hypothetical protein
MARPIVGRYFEGALCRKCGTTTRYIRSKTCVECAHRRNIKKYPARSRRSRAADYNQDRTDQAPGKSSVASALDYYSRTPSARARSQYLDERVRERFANLLDDAPTEPATATAGELHRASLPVGVAHAVEQRQSDVERRHAENDAIRAALKRVIPKLPDLATIPDVLAALPPAVVEPVAPTRLPYQIAVLLRELGVEKRATQTRYQHAKKIYILRRAGHYGAMRQVDLAAAHTRMVNAGSLDSLKSEPRHLTAGSRKAAQRADMGEIGPLSQGWEYAGTHHL